MDSESENEILETKPLDIVEVEDEKDISLPEFLPELSKKKYEAAYKLFMDWREERQKTSFSENVVIAYFIEIAKKYKSSTLWTIYSMLRMTLNINQNVDITKYAKLRAFLKRQAKGYRPKRSKTFTSQEINRFIKEAPDQEYLLTKTALIMGIMGACRRHELRQMKTTHLKDLGSALLVSIPDAKTKVMRTFTITGHFYDVVKKYADLRPPHVNETSFFLNYQKGKCTVQNVGINKFGAMGKQIARYLKLPNPESYTGHCFRRSSSTVLYDSGGDVKFLERHCVRTTTAIPRTVPEYNLTNSIKVEFDDSATDLNQDPSDSTSNGPSTLRSETWQNVDNLNFQLTSTNMPKMIFNNCSNITFNIISNNEN